MPAEHRGVSRRRINALLVVLGVLFGALVVRLAYLQTVKRAELIGWAHRIRFRVEPLRATRGYIYERDGKRPLAMSIMAVTVFAHRKGLRDIPKTAQRVAEMLHMDPKVVEEKLNGKSGTIWLAKRVDPRIGNEISLGYKVRVRRKVGGIYKYIDKREKLPGIGVQEETKRVYPLGSMAAQVLGYTDHTNHGGEGLEVVRDRDLSGRPGQMTTEVDARRRPIPETRHMDREPVNGKDVVVTLDTTIQQIAEDALGKMGELYHPESAVAVVLDPKTGEILALANYPQCNRDLPLKPHATKAQKDAWLARWSNRAVAEAYEPGSTLKVVTIAGALNEGMDPHAIVGSCAKTWKVPGGRITCTVHPPFKGGHGAVDMYKIIQYSCNIGAAHIALKLGVDKLYGYERKFGLLGRLKAGFGCEAAGGIYPATDRSELKLLNVGFGQGIEVTPLQMAAVYGAIANKGVYVTPRFIKEIRGADGLTVTRPSVPKPAPVVSKAAAAELTKMLMVCAKEGTGKPAQIDGRTVAGKTGSAEIAAPRGGYIHGQYIASFMGFAPATRPRLVIAVAVRRPQGSHWGAVVAAPVFKEIGEKALWYLKVPSDAPVKPKMSPKPGGGKRTA